MEPQHQPFLKRCLDLAILGGPAVEPNPLVGAVVVHEGKIIGEGYHRRFGGAHAEVHAVESVENKALLSESTLYVSLEPCNHHGKTPPCTELILKSGITKVVVGMVDPNPKMAGKSLEFLRSKGVDVLLNPDPGPFRRLIRHFIVNQTTGRPFITLKWAQSADGYIAKLASDRTPQRTRISDTETTRWVHALRHEHQSILVGSKTALIDQPALDCRFFPGSAPIPIVLDGDHELNTELPFFRNSLKSYWVQGREESIQGNVHKLRHGNGLQDLMEKLYQEHKIGSILVEGGRQVLDQFKELGLWDEAWVITSPVMLDEGVTAPVPGRDWEKIGEWKSGVDLVQRFEPPITTPV